jgi:hypothetical protein
MTRHFRQLHRTSERLALVVATMLVIALTAVSGAAAEPAFSFDATPGKLPKTVVPIHYAIELKPNL